MTCARSSLLRALVAAPLALAVAGGLAGCGSSDPVASALQGQTVTVTIPGAIGTSTAPVAPQESPAAPGSADGASNAADPTDPPAGGDGADASGDSDTTPVPAPGSGTDGSTPSATAAPVASAPRPTIHLLQTALLRDAPGGRVIGQLTPRTEFNSPTVLAVVRQRGSWLGVLSSALPNDRVGWISARVRFEAFRNNYRVDASLGRREVVVRRAGRIVQRFPVAIGGVGTPTPRGRFAVTDKLLTQSAASPYGCCILALSGHQLATPQGWGGGDRIAIHATNLPETIGTRASLGCLRAPTEAIRRVVSTVPLGTIVTITA
ncbi:L,D-transpeptidase family protein [Conexibacter sp. CPCC 206217]|uniref:L,D-transpeptidase family protein n=1 Tax=Conexibacter sp. CPCC 206217 TaxID=3064574 RepID=UPI0027168B03|nr:L,D-transpeptidase family protein [Conexibacter sp. CPCC 206217]MDO8209239.1 L,D-transpeptidase family protein [Conexibacter sp. CPCC 206217]